MKREELRMNYRSVMVVGGVLFLFAIIVSGLFFLRTLEIMERLTNKLEALEEETRIIEEYVVDPESKEVVEDEELVEVEKNIEDENVVKENTVTTNEQATTNNTVSANTTTSTNATTNTNVTE